MRKFLVAALLVALVALPVCVFALSVGEEAPDFTADSTHGKITLGDYEGKKTVVLAFYFKDFTGG